MYHKRFLPYLLLATVTAWGCEEGPNPGQATTMNGGSISGGGAPVPGATPTAGQPTPEPKAGTPSPGGETHSGGSPGVGGQLNGGNPAQGGQPVPAGEPVAGGQPTPGGVVPPHDGFASLKNNVRFKGVYRLKNDFINMLGLTANTVCNELDRYPCFDFVHEITLGGVDAYEANIYFAPTKTTSVAPLSVERIALHACTKRYDTDVMQPEMSLIFGKLDYSADGSRLADVNSEGVSETLTTLFKRILLRLPTDEELGLFRQMYADVLASADAVKPAREWAILSCFVLMTSIESLFY